VPNKPKPNNKMKKQQRIHIVLVILSMMLTIATVKADLNKRVTTTVVSTVSVNNKSNNYVPNFAFACNLGADDNWLAIVNQPCSKQAVLVVPPNSRLLITGTVSSSCGTYSSVFINDVNAGYVEQQYLCKPRIPLIRGDAVVTCNMPSSWDFLNLFPTPFANQAPLGQLGRHHQATIVDGPAYNNRQYMVKVYNYNTQVYGWVDATYICMKN